MSDYILEKRFAGGGFAASVGELTLECFLYRETRTAEVLQGKEADFSS